MSLILASLLSVQRKEASRVLKKGLFNQRISLKKGFVHFCAKFFSKGVCSIWKIFLQKGLFNFWKIFFHFQQPFLRISRASVMRMGLLPLSFSP